MFLRPIRRPVRLRSGARPRTVGLILAASLALPANAAVERPLYRDAHAPVAARVDDLLARMTLAEKVAQLVTVWEGKVKLLDTHQRLDPAARATLYPNGIGGFARPSDAAGAVSPRVLAGRDVRSTIELVNDLQRDALTHTRLGIPILFHEEGLHGYAALGATSFPVPIALASSWDPDLVRRTNVVTAREMSARGVTQALSPVVDIARDPRWGRIEETFGEDPYLVGELGVAAIEGLEGVGKPQMLAPGKVFATLKHLTGHGQPESGTNTGPAPISERELRENFFPPFEQAIARAGPGAVMPSYNEIDGVPSHASKWLLQTVLRGEWGFTGAIVSDYSAIDQIADLHHIAPDHQAAAIIALSAGVDSDLPDGNSYKTLAASVAANRVSVALIDDAVRKMLEIKFRAGLFEHPYADAKAAVAVTNNADARALARVAAARSMVLLKNDGTLPLALPSLGAAVPVIAVIGPNAAVARLGGYYGQPPVTVSLLDGIKAKVGSRARIVTSLGVKITENDDWWEDKVTLADPAENAKRIAAAVDVARGADTIVLAIGDTEQTSREGWADNHLGDRASIDLVGEQQALFNALKALGKPIVVVMINGRPLAINRVAEQANAVVEGWYLGEQGGTALADALFGDVNPGGKLPVTIARSVGQLPMFYNYKPSAHRGYLFSDKTPLFPFGFGLSYTTFAVGEPRLSTPTIRPDGTVDVSVEVRNTGARAGDEVVQLYVHDKVPSVTRPVKELKAFERVTLQPGEARTVKFTLDHRAFELWNLEMKRVVEPGEFEIMAGNSSVALKSATLTIAR
ncbi:glycoside hydrolase family 3 C-terminal domain-containing protein [Polymorphobacter sp. PAMC 29334]|uniref:glycoside hydrolase family 3 N-terminal domain-containing protein n=1 Tax=Polymorphobacter sp. PAMC 29334 TaxID=2862331 RepID=UPI001C7592D4|nr:glycoside hydrolase family 3 N-terminal domain-containing protein [Polymorphobacter sp. PAMC 29334]QYE35848.1 glycoside hydrolase family 3 C-terminal domain-containing protein [Polymorphobacter sp. PAMC 29334]